MVDQKEVEIKALTVVEQANAIKVVDSESYVAAGEMWKTIKNMMKEISDTFDPIISKAHASHKEALAQKEKFYKPLETVNKSVKKSMSDYDAEQERIRKEEERRLAEIARKEEEERKLQEAIEAESRGDVEESEAIMEEEVYVPPVVILKSTPKVSGGPVYREVWKIRIKDVSKVPREYMLPDEKKLGQMARALKRQFNVSGVEAYPVRV